MRALVAELKRFALADANVLIVGATGVGKDLVARTLHALSDRRRHPFVVVDCPGLAATLIDLEMNLLIKSCMTCAGGGGAWFGDMVGTSGFTVTKPPKNGFLNESSPY